MDPRSQSGKLTASDGMAADILGVAVAISGDTVVVGATGVNSGLGAAYVFVKPTGGWSNITEVAKLTASDTNCHDRFGSSVAIRGGTVVVGAPQDYILCQPYGAIYVFVKPAMGWTDMTETAKLFASDAVPDLGLGYSVSFNGDTVVAGAPNWETRNAGAAYVFVKPVKGWMSMTETAKLTPSQYLNGSCFGVSVAISGETVVAGDDARYGDYHSVHGVAYIFVKPASGWANMTETAKLTASDGVSAGLFGGAVALNGDTAVVGAPATFNVPDSPGSAYVFLKPTSGWQDMSEVAKLTARDGATRDYFGYSVFFGGYSIVIGAPGADIGANVDQGAAYVFAKPKTGWRTTMGFNAKLTAPDGKAGDGFGTAVSINNGTVVVGTPNAAIGSNSQQGAAYVFSKQ
jgi:hypothetical protein